MDIKFFNGMKIKRNKISVLAVAMIIVGVALVVALAVSLTAVREKSATVSSGHQGRPLVETALASGNLTWHTIGASGEPAFSTINWKNWNAGYNVAQYAIDYRTGIVYLRGLVTGDAIATNIFALPIGFRPVSMTMVPGLAPGPNIARIDIYNTDGSVRLTNATGWVTTNWLSLDGISFSTN